VPYGLAGDGHATEDLSQEHAKRLISGIAPGTKVFSGTGIHIRARLVAPEAGALPDEAVGNRFELLGVDTVFCLF